jgi:hypothetical protein
MPRRISPACAEREYDISIISQSLPVSYERLQELKQVGTEPILAGDQKDYPWSAASRTFCR